ncbi:MAG TPA: hypothetical protein VMU64_05495 [Acidimicrobiales bacterium]|nr:hypothetical protein [Acidimicrobiales bacterium]
MGLGTLFPHRQHVDELPHPPIAGGQVLAGPGVAIEHAPGITHHLEADAVAEGEVDHGPGHFVAGLSQAPVMTTSRTLLRARYFFQRRDPRWPLEGVDDAQVHPGDAVEIRCVFAGLDFDLRHDVDTEPGPVGEKRRRSDRANRVGDLPGETHHERCDTGRGGDPQLTSSRPKVPA